MEAVKELMLVMMLVLKKIFLSVQALCLNSFTPSIHLKQPKYTRKYTRLILKSLVKIRFRTYRDLTDIYNMAMKSKQNIVNGLRFTTKIGYKVEKKMYY